LLGSGTGSGESGDKTSNCSEDAAVWRFGVSHTRSCHRRYVDLGQSEDVGYVRLYNRGDSRAIELGAWSQMTDVEIRVGETPPAGNGQFSAKENSLCRGNITLGAYDVGTFRCNLKGRFVVSSDAESSLG
jgi:hypothetical protein